MYIQTFFLFYFVSLPKLQAEMIRVCQYHYNYISTVSSP